MAVFELSWGALPVKGSCVGFKHKEGMSELFELDLYVVLKEETELDVEELLLTRASLDVRFTESLLDVVIPPMQVAGTVTAMELLRMEADLALYRVRLSPQLWLLTQSVHSRVWTQKTLEEIATAVLEESGLIAGEDFELKISSPLPKEEHVTQYKESSFDFLSRWFEREGWYYYFEHEGGKDKLIVTDDKATHESLRATPVRYVPQSGADGSASDAFDNVTQRLRLMPAGVRLTDYDYAKPGLELLGRAAVSPQGMGDLATYGYRFFSSADGQRLATIRAEELKANEDVLGGTGAPMNVRAGYLFDLTSHPRPELNRTFLCTAATHYGYQPSLSKSWGKAVPALKGDQVYRLEISFISSDLQFRARRRAKWPQVDGFENAIVDGPASSPYAQIDDDGRYKAKFKFDESPDKDGKASTWLRMAQPHGGAPEGFHLPLRKGTEVICSFLGGDPDRPIIVGALPNAVTPSPVVASNHTQNVFQSGSKNWLVCEDQQGAEWISIYTPAGALESNLYLGPPRPEGGFGLTAQCAPACAESGPNAKELGPFSVQLRTQGSGELYAGGNINENAGGDVQIRSHGGEFHWFCEGAWFRDVGGNAFETYTKTLTQRVHLAADYQYENTLDVTITGPTVIKENATTKMTATGAATHDYKQNLTQVVLGDSKETMGALHKETIKAGHYSWVLGDEKITIGGAATHTITASQKIDVGGDKKEKVVNNYTWNADNVTLTIQGNFDKQVQSSWFETITNHRCETVIGAKIGMVGAFHLELGASIKTAISNTIMLELNKAKLSFSGLIGAASGMSIGITGFEDKIVAFVFDAGVAWIKVGAIESDVQGGSVN